jgi:hypothetical protein
MSAENFKSTDVLLKSMSVRKTAEDGDKVKWLQMQWIQVRKEEPGKLYYKYTLQQEVEFSIINLKKSGAAANVASLELKPLYAGPPPLSAPKSIDLRKLMKFVPPIHHAFYNSLLSLTTSVESSDVHEDELLEESEEDDNDFINSLGSQTAEMQHGDASCSRKPCRRKGKSTKQGETPICVLKFKIKSLSESIVC